MGCPLLCKRVGRLCPKFSPPLFEEEGRGEGGTYGSPNVFVQKHGRLAAGIGVVGFFLRPSVVEASEGRTVIRIPLSRRSRNHLGSMYFGALCAGADLAGALTAMRRIDASGRRISLIFKDVKAQFFKRAEGDVLFSCEDGEAVAGLVRRAVESGGREELPVRILATVPEKLGPEPVAEFLLTLSLKRRD